MIQTTVPSESSGMIFKAVATEPPLLIPAKTPSSRANRLVISFASSSETSTTLSTLERSKIFGKYSSGHLRIPGILAPSAGCAPII